VRPSRLHVEIAVHGALEGVSGSPRHAATFPAATESASGAGKVPPANHAFLAANHIADAAAGAATAAFDGLVAADGALAADAVACECAEVAAGAATAAVACGARTPVV
jgi:hypothetical protein